MFTRNKKVFLGTLQFCISNPQFRWKTKATFVLFDPSKMFIQFHGHYTSILTFSRIICDRSRDLACKSLFVCIFPSCSDSTAFCKICDVRLDIRRSWSFIALSRYASLWFKVQITSSFSRNSCLNCAQTWREIVSSSSSFADIFSVLDDSTSFFAWTNTKRTCFEHF